MHLHEVRVKTNKIGELKPLDQLYAQRKLVHLLRSIAHSFMGFVLKNIYYGVLKNTLEPEFLPNMPPPFLKLIIRLEMGQFYFGFSLIFLGRVLQGMGDHSDTIKTLCCVLSKCAVFFVWTTVLVEIW